MGMIWPRAAAMLMLSIGLAMGPVACQKSTARSGDGPTVQTASDLYAAGRFSEAQARAEVDFRRLDGEARRAAALTAGLSAHALNRTAEARGWLTPLINDPNPEIAGRANAALGLIAEKAGSQAEAAERLVQASNLLRGDEAARAAFRAGHSFTALNRFDEAATAYRNAVSKAESPQVRSAYEPYIQPGPFSVQMGVFTSKLNADRKAAESRPRTTHLGLGVPFVKPVNSAGGKPGVLAFSVRVGSFVNRHAAALACQKLGSQAVVVAAAE